MQIAYDESTHLAGFGISMEEAKRDLQLNLCIKDIQRDTSGVYTARSKELGAWMPIHNLVVLRDKCGIVFDKGLLKNTATDSSVIVEDKKFCHYLYLYNLLPDSISFADFSISLQKEMDIVMNVAAPSCSKIAYYPYLKPGDLSDARSLHFIDDTCFVASTEDPDVTLVSIDDSVIEVTKVDDVDDDCMLAYVFARYGYKYDGTFCRKVFKKG